MTIRDIPLDLSSERNIFQVIGGEDFVQMSTAAHYQIFDGFNQDFEAVFGGRGELRDKEKTTFSSIRNLELEHLRSNP